MSLPLSPNLSVSDSRAFISELPPSTPLPSYCPPHPQSFHPSPSASVSFSSWPCCFCCLFFLPQVPLIWVPSSHPSFPSCKNHATPRRGSYIPNSIHPTAQSFSSGSFNSLWGSGKRVWELLAPTHPPSPPPPSRHRSSGARLSALWTLAPLSSSLSQLSHPLLALSLVSFSMTSDFTQVL